MSCDRGVSETVGIAKGVRLRLTTWESGRLTISVEAHTRKPIVEVEVPYTAATQLRELLRKTEAEDWKWGHDHH